MNIVGIAIMLLILWLCYGTVALVWAIFDAAAVEKVAAPFRDTYQKINAKDRIVGAVIVVIIALYLIVTAPIWFWGVTK